MERATYRPDEIAIGLGTAVLAQLLFALALASPTPPTARADISDEHSRPIAVPIVPVLPDGRVLKLGSPRPSLGNPNPLIAKTRDNRDEPLPSTQAKQTADAITDAGVSDAAAPAEQSDASTPGVIATLDASAAPASSEQGDPSGSKHGTETDPLKARAINMYRGQVAGFFLARFNIRGKLPFDELKPLRASASVSVSQDRRVSSFSVSPSGNPTFDAEVQRTLSSVQSSGALLPNPPYPEVLSTPFTVVFQCTVQAACE